LITENKYLKINHTPPVVFLFFEEVTR